MLPKSTVKGIEGGKHRKMGSNGQKKIIRGILILLFPFELPNDPGLICPSDITTI